MMTFGEQDWSKLLFFFFSFHPIQVYKVAEMQGITEKEKKTLKRKDNKRTEIKKAKENDWHCI